jgi:imidazolonepropionase-like amidohydrolase
MLMHVADSMGFTLNTFTHILEGYKVADKMKEHGAYASSFSDWWAYKYEVKDAIPHNASILTTMGIVTAINSDDAEMGRRLNQEAAKGIRYGGMSEVDALKLVTLNPAIILHIDEYVGSIEVGKHADLVLWNDHPLSVYANVEKTFVDGKLYYDREEMERRLERDRLDRNRIANKMIEAASRGEKVEKPQRKMERYYHCDTEE